MFQPWKFLSYCISEKRFISARAKLYNSDTSATKEIKFIYSILGYLDSKASALMRFDGIILAVLAIVAQNSSFNTAAISAVVALLILSSIACCVLVIDVSWPFLSIARPENGKNNDSAEVQELQKVLYFRERAYRWAWGLSALAMIAIFFGAVLFFGTRLGAF